MTTSPNPEPQGQSKPVPRKVMRGTGPFVSQVCAVVHSGIHFENISCGLAATCTDITGTPEANDFIRREAQGKG